MKPYKHIFGPVPSRRLGFSLGVDLVPLKTCTLDCVYCQVGKTTDRIVKRRSFFPYQEVIVEIIEKLKKNNTIDYITFSGSGEPTLSLDIGKIIEEIKKVTCIPVAVITNSSLLYLDKVKNDLIKADLLVPSLNAVYEVVFQKINNPAPCLKLVDTLRGLVELRTWYKGEIRLEVMLVKGINDSKEHIDSLGDWIKKIKPDKVEINTVIRPPADSSVEALEYEELEKIAQKIGNFVSAIKSFPREKQTNHIEKGEELICNTLSRRPLNINDLVSITKLSVSEIKKVLNLLLEDKSIKSKKYKDEIYYFVFGD